MKKVYCSIYCKIYTDSYNVLAGQVTGNEIFNHLMNDAGCTFDEGENRIPGDLNIWYLGSNEKFGNITLRIPGGNTYEWEWGHGDSNFKRIEKFILTLQLNGVITNGQYQTLNNAIKEGKKIGDMYLIREYLETKNNKKYWIPRITNTKNRFKTLLKTVENKLKENI